MSRQPLTKEDSDLEILVQQFYSLDKSDIGQFRARRVFKSAEEYYNKYQNNLSFAYLYANSFFAINKNDIGIKFFREKILPLANINTSNKDVEIYRKFALLLYLNKEYKEALEIILSLSDENITKPSYMFLSTSIPIYFENNLYEKMLESIKLSENFLTNNNDILPIIYLCFYYYHNGNYTELIKQINEIIYNIGLEKLDNSNIDNFFEELKKELVINVEKPQPTELETEFLENIKKVVLMYVSYQPEEISFDENISFNNRIYPLHIERCEEGGFYGEIKGIDGCYTQGKTLEELRENILEVLELYSEEELTSA